MAKQKSKYPVGKHPNTLANLAKGRKKFTPGQSGNPAGRPPDVRYVSEELKKLLATGMVKEKAIVEALAHNLVRRALKNSYDLNILLDRTEGKVLQPVGGENGEPIKYEISVKDAETKQLTDKIIAGGQVVSHIGLS